MLHFRIPSRRELASCSYTTCQIPSIQISTMIFPRRFSLCWRSVPIVVSLSAWLKRRRRRSYWFLICSWPKTNVPYWLAGQITNPHVQIHRECVGFCSASNKSCRKNQIGENYALMVNVDTNCLSTTVRWSTVTQNRVLSLQMALIGITKRASKDGCLHETPLFILVATNRKCFPSWK
jgi:hypothetical protein